MDAAQLFIIKKLKKKLLHVSHLCLLLGDNSKENITNALYRKKTVEVVEIGQILLLRAYMQGYNFDPFIPFI